MHVLLVVDVQDLENKELFEAHLKKEGFNPIAGEEYAYEGESTTPVFHTRAYIFQVVGKALEKSPSSHCAIMTQLGENPMESYLFDHNSKQFQEIKG